MTIYATDMGKEEILRENSALRQRLAELEACERQSKRIQEALLESEARYWALFEHSTDPMAVFTLDGTFRHVNRALEAISGWSREELIGQHYSKVATPAALAQWNNRIRCALAGEPLPRVFETECIHRDGSLHPLECRTHFLRDKEGNLLGFEGIFRDITTRKQAERALRESEQKYRSLFQNAPISIWEEDLTKVGHWLDTLRRKGVVDLTAYLQAHPEALRHVISCIHLLDVNEASITMFEARDKQELISRFADMFTDQTSTGLSQVLAAIWEGRSQFEIACTASTFKGHRVDYVLRWWIPTVSNSLDLSRVIVTAINITDRVRLEEQLRQSQKLEAIGTLAGGIAHDFNNALFAIIGYTELAMGNVPQDSQTWNYLQQVLKASTRAKKLVQQILTFSRKSIQQRKPVDLRPLVKETLKMLRASLPTTIDIRPEISETAAVVQADPTQIQQVLMNLCANAEHAMRQTGGVLEVRVEVVEVDQDLASRYRDLHPGAYVRLTVRDTGYGIPPEIKERIFEPFFTTKKAGEGTGMGLAVVHGIVADHSGSIIVQSTPGKGTTFVVYIPRINDTTDEATPSTMPIPCGTGTILFVDDEETLAHLGQTILESLGYEVISKTSSLEALETFRATPQRFDLVITDQTMPHLTGEALAHELRHIRPDIPIILCTGFSHTVNAERAAALGIDAFCTKPFVIRDLAVIVQQALPPLPSGSLDRW